MKIIPLDSLWLDVKLGVRMLIKYPGLALVGVVGIAAAVAIATGSFSVIYGTFLSPSLPFDEGDRIVSIEIWNAATSKPERRILHNYFDWREGLKTVQELSAFRTITPNLIAPGSQPESVRVASMSASGFEVARVRPLIGRYLTKEDERTGAAAVVVIGESVWRNRFGSDPAILGRTIQLGARHHAVVGVMPASFAFPINHRFWIPLHEVSVPPEPLTGPDAMVFGRLAPGATLENAQAELTTIGQRTAQRFPKIYAQLRFQALPYPQPFLGIRGTSEAFGLHLMNGMVVMLLVLICLNIAILVYTRTARRQGEISIRSALGAKRGRIITQLFIEAFVLSGVGTAAGVAIAELALRQIAAATLHIAPELPFWVSFHLLVEAVLYGGALSVLAAAVVGIAPALQATRREVQTGLRVIGAGGSGMRLGKTWTVLVVAQIGCAVALLPGAVSLAWENLRVEYADPGIATHEFLTARLGMDVLGADAAATGTPEFARRYADRQTELMRLLAAEGRVANTTFAMAIPGDEPGALIETQDNAPGPRGGPLQAGGMSRHEVRFNRVDLNLFRALHVPTLSGRGFEPSDIVPVEASPADTPEGSSVMVNQSLAQRLFGGNALGRRIRYAGKSANTVAGNGESGRWYEIVGIVKDFPSGVSPGMNGSPLKVYHAAAAGQVQPAKLILHVRSGSPSTFSRRLSEIATAVDPEIQLRDVVSLDEALRKEQWIRRLEATIMGFISLSVLMLSSAGIYALMSFTVSQRRKEIGIRIALGADRTRIVASIFSRALGQLGAGAALGAVLATMLNRGSGDHAVQNSAGVVLVVVAFFMMAVGLLAALGPARRCLAIEPTQALREQ